MFEYKIGYTCENGETIKVTGVGFTESNAYDKAINKLITYPYFLTNQFDPKNVIK